ncbi:hypothetical protein VTK26DRAFT_1333 [Humicola hyalothermophila]
MVPIQQSSIRSFFQPRSQPVDTAPPSAAPPSTQDSSDGANPPSPPPVPPPPAVPPSQPVAPKPVTIPVTLPPNGVPVLPSPPSLPSGATIAPLAEQHLPALRRINSLLLPVAYPDSFYARVLDPLASGLFSRAILWQDSGADKPKVIGGLICRLEPNPFLDAQGRPLPNPPPPPHQQKSPAVPLDTPYHAIYIQSLVLLSPYRSLGLAAAALEHIISSALLLPEAGSNLDIRTIYAHVWTENEEGLKWYEARGFARQGPEPVKGYYFKLRPDTAWIVRRHIGPSSALQPPSAPPPQSLSTHPPPPTTTPNGPGAASVLAAAVNLPPIASQPPPAAASAPPRKGPPPSASPAPPPPASTSAPVSASASTTSLSFQNMRPETEWNDLPPDMIGGSGGRPVMGRSSSSNNNNNNGQQQQQQHLSPPVSMPASGASSRSSSTTGRKRRERAYPSAAFGN